MSKQFFYKIFVAAFVVFGVAIVTNLEINQNVNAHRIDTPNLVLALSTLKSSYLQLETVPLTLKLSNQTSEPVKWQGILTLGADMDLLVQPPSGEEKIIEGVTVNIAALASAPITLNPRQEIESKVVIDGVSFFERAFPSPGNYQVRVRFSYEKIDGEKSSRETVLSNPVTINIATPQGVDLRAYNYLQNTLEQARRARVSSEELITLQKNFVETYSGSVYAKRQIWNLAITYKALGEDLKAMRELCKLSNDNTFYSPQVERLLNTIDVKLHPVDLTPLPEDAPIPARPHPCLRLRN